MNANSEMRLTKYTVNKLYYEMNDKFNFSKLGKIRINPDFKRDITKLDENNYSIKLNVKICEGAQEEVIPFFAEISITGTFNFELWEASDKIFIAENNSTAILFPYLRSLLSTITTTGNLPPYFLPVMNVSKLFAKTD